LAASDRVVGRRDYGGVLIVRARLGPRQALAEFMVDTGCVYTSLTPHAVERLGLDRRQFTGRRRIFTAAGTSMIVPTGPLASLRLGAVEVRNLEVALLDLPAGVSLDGLLGVNVLERFRVTIEFRSATLVLRPEQGR
jgi:predicted aspartyl protease